MMKKFLIAVLPLTAILFLASCSESYHTQDGRYGRDDPYYGRDSRDDDYYRRNGNVNDYPGNYPDRNANWVRLGSQRLSGRGNYQVINLNTHNAFRQLMFDVRDNNLQVSSVQVRYDDGRTEEVRLRGVRGENARVVNLNNSRYRYIRQVILYYDSYGYSRTNSVVTVYGR